MSPLSPSPLEEIPLEKLLRDRRTWLGFGPPTSCRTDALRRPCPLQFLLHLGHRGGLAEDLADAALALLCGPRRTGGTGAASGAGDMVPLWTQNLPRGSTPSSPSPLVVGAGSMEEKLSLIHI